jgi:hypothetical protein
METPSMGKEWSYKLDLGTVGKLSIDLLIPSVVSDATSVTVWSLFTNI